MMRKGVHVTFMYGEWKFEPMNTIRLIMLSGTVTSMYAISFERRSASAHFKTYELTSRSYGYKLAIVHVRQFSLRLIFFGTLVILVDKFSFLFTDSEMRQPHRSMSNTLQLAIVAVLTCGFLLTYGYAEGVAVICTITTPRGETYQLVVGVSEEKA